MKTDDNFGICAVCNNGMDWTDRGYKSVRTIAITSGGQPIYLHLSCCSWALSLIRKGQCDKCHREGIELVGCNSYGKLCMDCAATLTILPLSEYRTPANTDETPEEVDQYLRDAGYDPDVLVARMRKRMKVAMDASPFNPKNQKESTS